MLRALIWKEVREIWVIAAVGLAINYWIVVGAMGFQLGFVSNPDSSPFGSNDSTITSVTVLSSLVALILGWWQNYHEEIRETRRFLYHRPLKQMRIIAIKAIVGLSTSLLIAVIPILHYTLWAATPGTHPSPFYWWMTAWFLACIAAIPLLYLGGFLGGLAPNEFFGMRDFAMLAGILSGILVGITIQEGNTAILLIVISVTTLLFVTCIRHVTKTRDIA